MRMRGRSARPRAKRPGPPPRSRWRQPGALALKDWTCSELIEALFEEKRGVDPCAANDARQARLSKLSTPTLLSVVLDDPEGDEGAIAANVIIERAGGRGIDEYMRSVYIDGEDR